jgi:hypothetical protein
MNKVVIGNPKTDEEFVTLSLYLALTAESIKQKDEITRMISISLAANEIGRDRLEACKAAALKAYREGLDLFAPIIIANGMWEAGGNLICKSLTEKVL